MPATYEPIATTTLSSSAASITFDSIPNTYTDLRLVWTGTENTGGDNLALTFNGTTGSSTAYSDTLLGGDGASAFSSRNTSTSTITATAQGLDTTKPFFITIDLFSYAGSTNKTCLITSSEDLNGSGYVVRRVGLYRSTSAISQIKLAVGTYTMKVGTTATLYGILKA